MTAETRGRNVDSLWFTSTKYPKIISKIFLHDVKRQVTSFNLLAHVYVLSHIITIKVTKCISDSTSSLAKVLGTITFSIVYCCRLKFDRITYYITQI